MCVCVCVCVCVCLSGRDVTSFHSFPDCAGLLCCGFQSGPQTKRALCLFPTFLLTVQVFCAVSPSQESREKGDPPHAPPHFNVVWSACCTMKNQELKQILACRILLSTLKLGGGGGLHQTTFYSSMTLSRQLSCAFGVNSTALRLNAVCILCQDSQVQVSKLDIFFEF